MNTRELPSPRCTHIEDGTPLGAHQSALRMPIPSIIMLCQEMILEEIAQYGQWLTLTSRCTTDAPNEASTGPAAAQLCSPPSCLAAAASGPQQTHRSCRWAFMWRGHCSWAALRAVKEWNRVSLAVHSTSSLHIHERQRDTSISHAPICLPFCYVYSSSLMDCKCRSFATGNGRSKNHWHVQATILFMKKTFHDASAWFGLLG